MIAIDTSAIVAILIGEPDWEMLARTIAEDTDPRLSAANFVEASLVLSGKAGIAPEADKLLDEFVAASRISVEPVTIEHAFLARSAFASFGKGRHPAGLNYGDCFAYALAKASNVPLLFKGNDFSQTDLVSALPR